MNAKKKILAVALAASMAVLAVGGSSLAYFTDTDSADNVFTVGNIKIDLTEPNWEAEGKEEAKDMYPGEPVAKDPTVTNTGANPAVVRIKVTLPGDKDYGLQYRTDYVTGKLGDNWVDGGDGYFYYTLPLDKENPTTDALFDQVVLGTNVTNDYSGEEKHIDVKVEAVQAQGIFTKYADMEDGIDADELGTVKAFFESAGF